MPAVRVLVKTFVRVRFWLCHYWRGEDFTDYGALIECLNVAEVPNPRLS